MSRKHIKHVAPDGSAHIKPPVESDDAMPPVFCFQHLQKDFCISSCSNDEKQALIDKLGQLSQLTWRQLREAGRSGVGYEIIAQNSMRVSIPFHVPKLENLIRFKFKGNAPVVGYRNKRIFHVLWIDGKLKVYSHGA